MSGTRRVCVLCGRPAIVALNGAWLCQQDFDEALRKIGFTVRRLIEELR